MIAQQRSHIISASIVAMFASTASGQTFLHASDGTITFEKPCFANSADPTNWDQITSTVAITRGDFEGPFNPLIEPSYDITNNTSPAGTLWHFGATAQDVADGTVDPLDFTHWKDARLSYFVNNGVEFINAPGVLYLVDDDTYVDITFEWWHSGNSKFDCEATDPDVIDPGMGGGGFRYTRAVVPSADCPADVNNDGVASPADFTAWLACFNDPMSAPFCDRADVNGSGATDPADFTAWLAAFSKGCAE